MIHPEVAYQCIPYIMKSMKKGQLPVFATALSMSHAPSSKYNPLFFFRKFYIVPKPFLQHTSEEKNTHTPFQKPKNLKCRGAISATRTIFLPRPPIEIQSSSREAQHFMGKDIIAVALIKARGDKKT